MKYTNTLFIEYKSHINNKRNRDLSQPLITIYTVILWRSFKVFLQNIPTEFSRLYILNKNFDLFLENNNFLDSIK